MQQVKYTCQNHPYIMSGVLAIPMVYILCRKMFGGSKSRRRDMPPNTVLLYQLERGLYAPSLSPFPLKLELYLKMNKIPYQNDFSSTFSKKKKTPWMSYNGEDIADSQFCIEYLNKKLNIDMNKGLTKEERAIAKAIQVLVDEHLYWTLVYFRWVYDRESKVIKLGLEFPWYVIYMIRKTVTKQLYSQGIGRHTHDEIKHIMLTDLQVLSDYLGKKPFMMGQYFTEVDLSVFGLLAQLVWHSMDDVCENLLQEQFPSLVNYCERIKEKFWPDWDECITDGLTRKATK